MLAVMAILIQLLMFAAIAGVVLWLVVLQGRKARANLQALAQRQGFTTRIMEFFGTKEITVGDAAFDAAWFVQTNQPEFLAAALKSQGLEDFWAPRNAEGVVTKAGN